MAFALNKSQSTDKQSTDKPKRSPLAGWLGLKPNTDDEIDLPEIDVAAGLSRALRSTSSAPNPGVRQILDIEPIREALSNIEAALYTIDTTRDIIEQAYEVVISAQDVEDAGGRSLLAESYDELRLSIDSAMGAIDERAAMLLGKNQRQIDVKLGGKAHYSISPTRLDTSARGLNLAPPKDAFATFEEITSVMGELDDALKKADRAAAGYCRDAQFLIERMNAQTP